MVGVGAACLPLGGEGSICALSEAKSALDGKIKLFAWGMKDIAFREKELNHWTKHFPDVKVVRYADAGHFVAEEKAGEMIREITDIL